MGTRAVVAVPVGESWRGRYVHWSGSPEHLGTALASILDRDGLATAAHTLTEAHYGWSQITGEPDPEMPESYRDGRFVVVPGYGIAYTEANGVTAESWLGPGDVAEVWAEYVYVLRPEGAQVWAVGPGGRLEAAE